MRTPTGLYGGVLQGPETELRLTEAVASRHVIPRSVDHGRDAGRGSGSLLTGLDAVKSPADSPTFSASSFWPSAAPFTEH
jgi:hypothetical protein